MYSLPIVHQKTPNNKHRSTKQCVQYFVNNPNSQNKDITDWIIVNFGICNPQIINPIPLLNSNTKMCPKTKFKTSATSQLSLCCFSTEPNHSPGCNTIRFCCYQCRSKLWVLKIKFVIWQKNCINARNALLQKFSVFFSGNTSINRKNIRFISYYLIFISFQKRNRSF